MSKWAGCPTVACVNPLCDVQCQRMVRGEPGLIAGGPNAVAAGANLKRLQQINWGWQDTRTEAEKRHDRGEDDDG